MRILVNIKFFKLISGEEVISSVEYHNDHFHSHEIILKNPMVVLTNGQQVMMMPLLNLTSDIQVTINEDKDILYEMTPIDELKNSYVERFGGIVQPSKSIIVQ